MADTPSTGSGTKVPPLLIHHHIFQMQIVLFIKSSKVKKSRCMQRLYSGGVQISANGQCGLQPQCPLPTTKWLNMNSHGCKPVVQWLLNPRTLTGFNSINQQMQQYIIKPIQGSSTDIHIIPAFHTGLFIFDPFRVKEKICVRLCCCSISSKGV